MRFLKIITALLASSMSLLGQGMRISQYPNTNSLSVTQLFITAISGTPGTNMNISWGQLSRMLSNTPVMNVGTLTVSNNVYFLSDGTNIFGYSTFTNVIDVYSASGLVNDTAINVNGAVNFGNEATIYYEGGFPNCLMFSNINQNTWVRYGTNFESSVDGNFLQNLTASNLYVSHNAWISNLFVASISNVASALFTAELNQTVDARDTVVKFGLAVEKEMLKMATSGAVHMKGPLYLTNGLETTNIIATNIYADNWYADIAWLTNTPFHAKSNVATPLSILGDGGVTVSSNNGVYTVTGASSNFPAGANFDNIIVTNGITVLNGAATNFFGWTIFSNSPSIINSVPGPTNLVDGTLATNVANAAGGAGMEAATNYAAATANVVSNWANSISNRFDGFTVNLTNGIAAKSNFVVSTHGDLQVTNKVGLGTNAPQALLDIQGTNSGNGYLLRVGSANVANGTNVFFVNTNGDTYARYLIWGNAGSQTVGDLSGNLQFYGTSPHIYSAAGFAFQYWNGFAVSDAMSWGSSGLVGIGTNAPAATLHVAGNNAQNVAQFGTTNKPVLATISSNGTLALFAPNDDSTNLVIHVADLATRSTPILTIMDDNSGNYVWHLDNAGDLYTREDLHIGDFYGTNATVYGNATVSGTASVSSNITYTVVSSPIATNGDVIAAVTIDFNVASRTLTLTNNITLTNFANLPSAGQERNVVLWIDPNGHDRTNLFAALGTAEYSVRLYTNSTSPMWTTWTNGTLYAVNLTARGTNVIATMTAWK